MKLNWFIDGENGFEKAQLPDGRMADIVHDECRGTIGASVEVKANNRGGMDLHFEGDISSDLSFEKVREFVEWFIDNEEK